MEDLFGGRAVSGDLENYADDIVFQQLGPTPNVAPTVTIAAPFATVDTDTLTTAAASDSTSTILTYANGDYIVFYSGAATFNNDIFSQRYSAAGDLVGSRSTVSSFTTGNQRNPAVTMLKNGTAVVTWESNGQDGTYNVYSRAIDAQGVAIGSDTLVNTAVTVFAQTKPVIAALENGGYVIVWESTTNAGGTSGSVYYQKYDVAGTAVGTAVTVDSGATGLRGFAGVAGLADGGFAVVYQGISPSFGNANAYLKRYSEAGVASTQIQMNANIGGNSGRAPVIAALKDGGYVAAYIYFTAGAYSINYTQYNSSGAAVRSGSVGGSFNALIEPLVVGLADGGFAITAGQQSHYVSTYRFSPNGTVIDSETSYLATQSGMAALADGGVILTGTYGTQLTVTRMDTLLKGTEQTGASLKTYIDIGDADNAGGTYTVTVSVDTGKIVVNASTSGVTVNASNPRSVVITGTLAQIKVLLSYNGAGTIDFVADSDTPPAFGTLTVAINDGTATTTTSETIKIIPVNDAPVLDLDSGTSGTGVSASVTAAATPVMLAPNATLADDNTGYQFATLTVAVVGGGSGQTLSIVASGDIALVGSSPSFKLVYYKNVLVGTVMGGSGEDLLVSFYAEATTAAVRDVMTHIAYATNALPANAAQKTITFTLVDGGGTANSGADTDSATATVSIAAAPAAQANNDSAKAAENAPVVINVLANETVPEGAVTPSVAKINGVSGTVFTLPSGAQVTINQDGTLSYDAHGAYAWLISTAKAAATGASNTSAIDSFSYTLATGSTATVQVTVTGVDSVGDRLVGSANADTITGTPDDDVIDGGTGADRMVGGAGSDIYYVDNPGDVARELANEGYDVVYASVSYSLIGQFIEELRLTGTAISGTGTGYANTLIGNAVDNILDGGEGNDVIDGGIGADRMIGGLGDDTFYVDNIGDVVIEAVNAGNDTVYASVSYSIFGQHIEKLVLTGSVALTGTGNGLANTIIGNSANNILDGGDGNDRIDGGLGADTMIGGQGDDIFYVDQVGDIAIEGFNGGNDVVHASISYSLVGQYVETLALEGNTAIDGTGNGLANTLYGNVAANILDGGAGNDIIDGGLGADTMIGGLGDDIFYVDNPADTVIESGGEGTDLVYASVSFGVGAGQYVENVTLTGNSAINATGNSQTNILIGNSGDNMLSGGEGNDTLNGMGGADTMIGGLGDDIFYVDQIGDVAIERANEGNDLVYASITYSLAGNYIEGLTLTGSADIDGTGTKYSNVLVGNSGANQLHGGAGADTLTGGGGADGFWFDTELGSSNVDTITDFAVGQDKFHLIEGVFSHLGDNPLDAAFTNNAVAQDSNDRILYDATTGNIYYDEDGTGAVAAVLFAKVTVGTVLTSADFVFHPSDPLPSAAVEPFGAYRVKISDLSSVVDVLADDASRALDHAHVTGLVMAPELEAMSGHHIGFAALQSQPAEIAFML